MANRYATQGRVLIEALKKRPHTYLDMLDYGISTSPWRRIKESLHCGEQLWKTYDRNGRIMWQVRKAR